MRPRKTLAIVALAVAFAGSAALAAEDQHHSSSSPPAATGQQSGSPSAAGMPMGGTAMPMMGPGGMMGGGMMGGMMGGGMMGPGGRGMGMMAQHIDGRLAFLRAELKITDAQLPLWNAFAQAMRDNAAAMPGMEGCMGMMNQSGTLPEKLAAREKMLSGRLEALRKLKAAADPLYAALSAEQKKTADELMVSPMGMTM